MIRLHDHHHRRRLIGAIVLSVLLLIGAGSYYQAKRMLTENMAIERMVSSLDMDSLTFHPRPTEPQAPTASPADSSSAMALPAAVQKTVGTFYAAYKLRDREALSTLFTPDKDQELLSLRTKLFRGVDPQGNPAAPTLFITDEASQYATAYTVSDTELMPNGTRVLMVTETRDNGTGTAIDGVKTTLTLVPADASRSDFLIDAYSYPDSPSKYGAFLIE